MGDTTLEIDLGTQPFDLAFHPSANLVAVALITGHVQLYKYGGDGGEVARLWNSAAHSESCRAVRFAQGGQFVLTASPDKSILATDVETGQPVARLADAHGVPINRLVNCGDTTVASGDDEGCIKVDEDTLLTGSSDGIIRIVSILPNKMIGVIGEHADFPVERLAFSHDRNILGSASHDNTLKLWDVKYLHEDDDVDEDASEVNAAPVGASTITTAQPVLAGSDDSDDQMEVEESKQRKKKGKKGKQRDGGGSSRSSFFDDL
uniref:Anaphase-promoting complex subunit 4 WD40 domain-containing protein n=1 Tax=Physcomitrium patens TaxID=3218 RepID=A0A7I4DU66_PHYPA